MLPAPQQAAASPHADRVEPRVITSPEHCDQSVICRSSLGQIGNELSTTAIAEGLNSDGYATTRGKLATGDWLRPHCWSAGREALVIRNSPLSARPRATSRSFTCRCCEERRKRSKASSGVILSRSIRIPLA